MADDCSPPVWDMFKEHMKKKNLERQAENINSILLCTSGINDHPSLSDLRAHVPSQHCTLHQEQLIECENVESESSDADVPASKDSQHNVNAKSSSVVRRSLLSLKCIGNIICRLQPNVFNHIITGLLSSSTWRTV